MVRAPCCDKMGLNKGSWTEEEDQILINHVQRYGHSNWKALPKQAGLLRCGKSCRLRWMNYLRPDIKRGNFSEEEEDMIISLHELLGNRWSQIAAKLPGRTDNEIKNVWHTHLKKRLVAGSNISKELNPNSSINQSNLNGLMSNTMITNSENLSLADVNISRVLSDTASSSSSNIISDSSNHSSIYQEKLEMDVNSCTGASYVENSVTDNLTCTSTDEDMNFWYRVFMNAGEMQDFAEL